MEISSIVVLGEAGLNKAKICPVVRVTAEVMLIVPVFEFAANVTVPTCVLFTLSVRVSAVVELVLHEATPEDPAAIVTVRGAVNDANKSLAEFGCPYTLSAISYGADPATYRASHAAPFDT